MITKRMEAVVPPNNKNSVISAFRKWFRDTKTNDLPKLNVVLKSTQEKKAAKGKCG